MQSAEVVRVIVLEEQHSQNGEDVVKEEEDEGNVGDGADTAMTTKSMVTAKLWMLVMSSSFTCPM